MSLLQIISWILLSIIGVSVLVYLITAGLKGLKWLQQQAIKKANTDWFYTKNLYLRDLKIDPQTIVLVDEDKYYLFNSIEAAVIYATNTGVKSTA